MEKRACKRWRNSSVTGAGVAVIASANSSTSFSSLSKRLLSAYEFKLRICSSVSPTRLPPAELMSIQNGHSTSLAARSWANCFNLAETRLASLSARLNRV